MAAGDRKPQGEVDQERVRVTFVCRLLPVTCLAPGIVEAIFDGRHRLAYARSHDKEVKRTCNRSARCGVIAVAGTIDIFLVSN